MEKQRKENIEKLLKAVTDVLDYEPLECNSEEEQEVYDISNDLRCALEEFLGVTQH